MKSEWTGKRLNILFLGVSGAIVPLVGWNRAYWLDGVFTALLLLLYLLDARRAISEDRYRFPSVPLWTPLALLALLSLFHLVRSPVPYASAIFLAHLAVAMAWYYVLLRSDDQIPVLPVVLVWISVLVPWMVVQKIWMGQATASGPFRNPNYSATVLLSCFGYAIGILLYSREWKVRFAHALLAVMCASGLLLTGSRSAMLGIIILLGAAVVFGMRRMRWIAGVLIVLVLVLPTTVRHRVLQGYKTDPHAFTRVKIWESALHMGLDHPLLGVGPNLFYEFSPQYAFRVDDVPVKYGRIARKPHNEYIRSWAEGGVAGVALTALFLFLVLRLALPAWTEGRAGPVLALAMVLFQALFHDITEVFASVLLGIWWLAQITPTGERPSGPMDGKRRRLLDLTAIFLTGLTLLINIDGISMIYWVNGRDLTGPAASSASKYLEVAQALNPIHPGVAQDLARVRFSVSGQSPGPENWSRAEEAILRAKALNRLDTVPLRLEAALYQTIARDSGEERTEWLGKAFERLREAEHLEPFNALILLQQAEVAAELGGVEDALRLLDRAVDLEPNYLEARRLKIRYLAESHPSLVPEAEKQLRLARQRAAGYRPLSSYERIILR